MNSSRRFLRSLKLANTATDIIDVIVELDLEKIKTKINFDCSVASALADKLKNIEFSAELFIRDDFTFEEDRFAEFKARLEKLHFDAELKNKIIFNICHTQEELAVSHKPYLSIAATALTYLSSEGLLLSSLMLVGCMYLENKSLKPMSANPVVLGKFFMPGFRATENIIEFPLRFVARKLHGVSILPGHDCKTLGEAITTVLKFNR